MEEGDTVVTLEKQRHRGRAAREEKGEEKGLRRHSRRRREWRRKGLCLFLWWSGANAAKAKEGKMALLPRKKKKEGEGDKMAAAVVYF